MSLLSQNQKGKKGSKTAKQNGPGGKPVVKPGNNAAAVNKRPVKTGGTRGS